MTMCRILKKLRCLAAANPLVSVNLGCLADPLGFHSSLLRVSPRAVLLSLSNICNMSCEFCFNSKLPVRKNLSVEEFEIVFQKFHKTPLWVVGGLGEITCNPAHPEIIDRLRRGKKYIVATSNCKIFSEALLKVHELQISVDQEHIRHGGCRSVEEIFDRRGDRFFPVIKGKIVISKPLAEEMDAIIGNPLLKFVDALQFSDVHFSSSPPPEDRENFTLLTKTLKKAGITLVGGLREKRGALSSPAECHFIKRGLLYINEFSRIQPCCDQVHNPRMYDSGGMSGYPLEAYDGKFKPFRDFSFCADCQLLKKKNS
jgi:MoaA/NifB/PqqE/SkfB family radical SAM enzyme